MYVCLCNAVTEKDIRRAAANGAGTLDELQEGLGVASCCGTCADHAVSILDEVQGTPVTPTLYIPSVAAG